jgi:hypothetical protein
MRLQHLNHRPQAAQGFAGQQAIQALQYKPVTALL